MSSRAGPSKPAIWAVFFFCCLSRAGSYTRANDLTGHEVQFFEAKVRPLLVQHCYACHSAQSDELKGELRLDWREGLLRGGASGPAVVPHSPESSRLIQAVRYSDPLLQMPPEGKLPQRDIDVLTEWVRMGLPDPRRTDPDHVTIGIQDADEEARDWWSFQPVGAPRPPSAKHGDWPTSAIDRFVLARLEQAGISAAPPADARTLIRRAYFDLIGLPPPPEVIEQFVQDTRRDSQQAFQRLIDQLLASPHYGERWGRHWLDVVRYADTSGCNGDFPVPEAYRYRNYVIDSFNKDKPYDQFIREQIAGDLLPFDSQQQRHEQVIATGYLAISRRFSSLGEEFYLTLEDTIDNLGKAILGLSVSCARCHDHKFDPIPQNDYYALYGIFQSTRYAFPGTEIYRHKQHLVPLVSAERMENDLAPYLERMAALDTEIYQVYSTMASLDTGKKKNQLRDQWKKLQEQRDALTKTLPEFDQAYAVSEGEAADAPLHIKGDPAHPGNTVPRGFLQLLGGQQLSEEDKKGSGRLQLAMWLTDADNPLTPRVLVNRVWQHHFGRGLVRTSNDFGTRGAPPTHPDLLDYLVRRFIEDGWSIKSLHRMIMRSRTYQIATIENGEYAGRDSDNRLLWTYNRRRLSAEEIRDAMLAVSGQLDRSKGGPHPFRPEWQWRYTQHRPFVDDFPTRRRSIYLMQQRIRLQPYLAVFDGADTNAATGSRGASTTPQQALFMMNSDFVHQQSRQFAERLRAETDKPAARIQRAFLRAFGRPATPVEVEEGLQYIARIQQPLEVAGIKPENCRDAAWASYCRALLTSNEFLFVE